VGKNNFGVGANEELRMKNEEELSDIVRYDTKMRCSIVGYEVCFVKIDN